MQYKEFMEKTAHCSPEERTELAKAIFEKKASIAAVVGGTAAATLAADKLINKIRKSSPVATREELVKLRKYKDRAERELHGVEKLRKSRNRAIKVGVGGAAVGAAGVAYGKKQSENY